MGLGIHFPNKSMNWILNQNPAHVCLVGNQNEIVQFWITSEINQMSKNSKTEIKRDGFVLLNRYLMMDGLFSQTRVWQGRTAHGYTIDVLNPTPTWNKGNGSQVWVKLVNTGACPSVAVFQYLHKTLKSLPIPKIRSLIGNKLNTIVERLWICMRM